MGNFNNPFDEDLSSVSLTEDFIKWVNRHVNTTQMRLAQIEEWLTEAVNAVDEQALKNVLQKAFSSADNPTGGTILWKNLDSQLVKPYAAALQKLAIDKRKMLESKPMRTQEQIIGQIAFRMQKQVQDFGRTFDDIAVQLTGKQDEAYQKMIDSLLDGLNPAQWDEAKKYLNDGLNEARHRVDEEAKRAVIRVQKQQQRQAREENKIIQKFLKQASKKADNFLRNLSSSDLNSIAGLGDKELANLLSGTLEIDTKLPNEIKTVLEKNKQQIRSALLSASRKDAAKIRVDRARNIVKGMTIPDFKELSTFFNSTSTKTATDIAAIRNEYLKGKIRELTDLGMSPAEMQQVKLAYGQARAVAIRAYRNLPNAETNKSPLFKSSGELASYLTKNLKKNQTQVTDLFTGKYLSKMGKEIYAGDKGAYQAAKQTLDNSAQIEQQIRAIEKEAERLGREMVFRLDAQRQEIEVFIGKSAELNEIKSAIVSGKPIDKSKIISAAVPLGLDTKAGHIGFSSSHNGQTTPNAIVSFGEIDGKGKIIPRVGGMTEYGFNTLLSGLRQSHPYDSNKRIQNQVRVHQRELEELSTTAISSINSTEMNRTSGMSPGVYSAQNARLLMAPLLRSMIWAKGDSGKAARSIVGDPYNERAVQSFIEDMTHIILNGQNTVEGVDFSNTNIDKYSKYYIKGKLNPALAKMIAPLTSFATSVGFGSPDALAKGILQLNSAAFTSPGFDMGVDVTRHPAQTLRWGEYTNEAIQARQLREKGGNNDPNAARINRAKFASKKTYASSFSRKQFLNDDSGALTLYDIAYMASNAHNDNISNGYEKKIGEWLNTQEGQDWLQKVQKEGISRDDALLRFSSPIGGGTIITESMARELDILHPQRHKKVSAEEYQRMLASGIAQDDIKAQIRYFNPTINIEDILENVDDALDTINPQAVKDAQGNVVYRFNEKYEQRYAKALGNYTGSRSQVVGIIPDEAARYVAGSNVDAIRLQESVGANDYGGMITAILENARKLAEEQGRLQEFIDQVFGNGSPLQDIIQYDDKTGIFHTTGKKANMGKVVSFLRNNKNTLFPNFEMPTSENGVPVTVISEAVNSAFDYAYRNSGAIGPREMAAQEAFLRLVEGENPHQTKKMMRRELAELQAEGDNGGKQRAEEYRGRVADALNTTLAETYRRQNGDITIGVDDTADLNLLNLSSDVLGRLQVDANGNITEDSYKQSLAPIIDTLFEQKRQGFINDYWLNHDKTLPGAEKDFEQALIEFTKTFRVVFQNPDKNAPLFSEPTGFGNKYQSNSVFALPYDIGEQRGASFKASDTINYVMRLANAVKSYVAPEGGDTEKTTAELRKNLEKEAKSVARTITDEITNKNSWVQKGRFSVNLPNSRFLELQNVSSEGLTDAQADLVKYGIGVSENVMRHMLGGEDNRANLINQYKYMYGKSITDKDLSLMSTEQIVDGIIKAMDLSFTGAENHDVYSRYLRYPSIEGTMDMLPLRMYLTDISDDAVAINKVLADYMRGDYDRDHGLISALTGSKSFSAKDFTEYIKELQSTQGIIKRIVDNENAIQTAKGVTPETLFPVATEEEINDKLISKKDKAIIEEIQQINRGTIGSWSTIATKVRNGINKDGDIGVNASGINQFLGFMVQGFLNTIEQDFISYKHVAKRIKAGADPKVLLGDANRLYEMLTSLSEGKGGDIGQIFDAFKNVGIMKEDIDARSRGFVQKYLYSGAIDKNGNLDDTKVLKRAQTLQKWFKGKGLNIEDERLGLITNADGSQRMATADEIAQTTYKDKDGNEHRRFANAFALSTDQWKLAMQMADAEVMRKQNHHIFAGDNQIGYLTRDNNVAGNENFNSDSQMLAIWRDIAGARPFDNEAVNRLSGGLDSNSAALIDATAVLSKILTVLQRDTGISGEQEYTDSLSPSTYSNYLAGHFGDYSANAAAQMANPIVHKALGNLPITAKDSTQDLRKLQEAVDNMPRVSITKAKLKKMGYASREEYDKAAFGSLSADYGTLIHKYLELDTNYGKKYGSLDKILTYLSEGLKNNTLSEEEQNDARAVESLETVLRGRAKALGLKKSDQTIDYYRTQGADIADWVKQQGYDIKVAEAKMGVGNLHGITDAFAVKVNDDGTKTGTFLDWKNYSGKVGKSAYIQALMYEAMGREVKRLTEAAFEKEGYKGKGHEAKKRFESDDTWRHYLYDKIMQAPTMKKFIGKKYALDENLFKEIGLVDRINSAIVHNTGDGAISLTTNPYGIPEVVFKKLIDGTETPQDFETFEIPEAKPFLLRNSKKIEKYYKTFGGRGNNGNRRGQGDISVEEEQNLTRYLALLQQRLKLEKDIYALELQRKAANEKGDAIEEESLRQRIEDLNILKDGFEREGNNLRHGRAVTNRELTNKDLKVENFQGRSLKRIHDAETKGEIEGKGYRDSLDSDYRLKTQIKNEGELNRLLQQRLRLEQQIASEQKTINTSFSRKEQNTLARVIGLQNGQITDIDSQISRIVGSGNIRQDKLAELMNQYQIDKGLMQAKVDANDHGSETLIDKMKFDIKRSMSRVMNYGISMRMLRTIPRSLSKIYQLTQQLESSITSLRIVTGMNREEAEAAMITYQKLGKQLGATTQEVAQSATTWLRQGYAVEEAGNLIDASMKLSKLGFMQADQATQVLTASLKGFKLEVGDAMDVVDKLTTMDQKAAVSAQGVSEALSLMANSARLAGLDIDQAIAMVSTVGEVTQQSMTTVGNAMKTMLARFGNVKAGTFSEMGEDSEETSANINDIEKVLGALGIKIRTASGDMREFDDVLKDIADQWMTLDSVSKNAVAGALGGVRQREAVVTLLENYDRYKELVEESANAEGTANKKYAAYMDSLEAKLKELTNTWEKFVQQVNGSGIIKAGVQTLTFFVDNMDKLSVLLAAVGGRLLALKAPAWIPKLMQLFGINKLRGFMQTQQATKAAGIRLASTTDITGKTSGKEQPTVNAINTVGQKTFTYFERLITAVQQKKGTASFAPGGQWNNGRFTASTGKGVMKGQNGKVYYTDQNGAVTDREASKIEAKEFLEAEQNRRITEFNLHGYRNRHGDYAFTGADGKRYSMYQGADGNYYARGRNKQQITDEDLIREFNDSETYKWSYDKKTGAYTVSSPDFTTKSLKLDAKGNLVDLDGNPVDNPKYQEAYNSARSQRQNQQQAKQGKALKYGSAAAAGVVAGVTSALMKNTVGNGTFDGLWNKTGQTVEATAGDKAIQGVSTAVSTGLISAIPGVGPILGPVLGPIIGDGIGGLWTYIIHADELKMKQRVAEAKENIEALGKIETAIDNVKTVFAKDKWEAEDYEAVKKYIDEVTVLITKYTGLVDGLFTVLKDWNSDLQNLSFDDLMTKLFDGTNEEKRELNEAIEVAVLREKRDESIKAAEETVKNSQKLLLDGKAISSGYQFNAGVNVHELRDTINQGIDDHLISQTKNGTDIYIAGETADEKLENAAQLRDNLINAYEVGDVESKRKTAIGITFGVSGPIGVGIGAADWAAADAMQLYIKQLNEYIDSVSEAKAELTAFEKELVDQNVQIGYITSGITKLNKEQLQSKTIQGLIDEVADAIEREGVAVRDAAGAIKSEYLTAITAQIKADSTMASVVKGETQTFNRLADARNKLSEATGKSADEAYSELRKLLDYATKENTEKFKNIAAEIFNIDKNAQNAEQAVEKAADALKDLVYQADPTNIYNLSRALRLSIEDLESMRDILGEISIAEAMMSPSELREKYSDYLTFFEDLADGALSQDNLEKLLSDHIDLFTEAGGDTSKLREKLLNELFGTNNKSTILYQRSIFNELLDNEDLFKKFKTQNKDLLQSTSKDMQDAFANSSNFESIWNYIFNYDGAEAEELQTKVQEYLKNLSLSYTSEAHKAVMNVVIEEQTRLLDEQIKNLQEQKEAISSINDERKKELELIKAQNALENAKKEKKMVYREGVGFVYEADEEAISQAQENLDKLDTEKQQENLQMQIDALELQKEILEYIPTIKDLQSQQELYKAWEESIRETGEVIANVGQIISAIDTQYSSKFEVDNEGITQDSKNQIEDQNTQTRNQVAKAWEDYNTEQDILNKMLLDENGNKLSEEEQKKVMQSFAYITQQSKVNAAYDSLNTAKTQADKENVGYDSASEIEAAIRGGHQIIHNAATTISNANTTDKDKTKNGTFKFLTGEAGAVQQVDLDKYFNKSEAIKIRLPYSKNENGEWVLDEVAPSNWGYLNAKGELKEEDWTLKDYNDAYDSAITKDNLPYLPKYTLIFNGKSGGDRRFAYIGETQSGKGVQWLKQDDKEAGRMATGTYDLQPNNTWTGLINEVGTEGIITPQGTFTALPSHTGIVPADITKNVWQLGKVAPELIAELGSLKKSEYISHNNTGITNNDTTNIHAINVYPTKDYDMDKLIAEAKAKVHLTKHNN